MPKKTKEEIIGLIKENKIIGISVDTCTFHNTAYKFDSPLLQAMKQFSSMDIPIIFSEIVTSEVISHINDNTKSAIDNLHKNFKEFQKKLQISDQLKQSINQINIIIKEEFPDIHTQSTKTLNDYIKSINAQTLAIDKHDILRQLHDYYFQIKAPFEENIKKRKEFPDAMALLSLECWAKEKDGYLIVVSNDSGWQNFSNNSENIICMDKLDECLGVFNLDNDSICSQLLENINSKSDNSLTKQIEETIISTLEEKVYFDIEASCYHEVEQINSPKINQWHIDKDIYNIILSNKEYITISCYLSLNATFYVEIEFSEEIDKYYVGRGSRKEEISEDDIDINLILTINRLDSSIDDIEAEQNTTINIFYSAPEPDFDQFCDYE